MKKSLFRILSVLMTVSLIFLLIPPLFAMATTTHSHPICGNYCSCSDASHSNYTWQEWDGTTTLYSGNYYLTKDLVLANTMILNYSYDTVLCLNGYSITCEKTVFDIYSYRRIWITDCKGTGKIESTNSYPTIGNNKYLCIWGGTIVNDYIAINAYPDTTTYICGNAKLESSDGIYAYPESYIEVLGGSITGKYSSITGHGNTTKGLSNIKIRGGTLSTLDIQYGNLTLSGGYIDGSVYVYSEDSVIQMTGGTISGYFYPDGKTSISGGVINNVWFGGDVDISAGTFRGAVHVNGSNCKISGGNFTETDFNISKKTWIYGGLFNSIDVVSGKLYLSGVPEINSLTIFEPNLVSAQNIDKTGSYAGAAINVSAGKYTSNYEWKNGDVIIADVKSDAVAEKFIFDNSSYQWTYAEHINNNLVMNILPHGTWGDNVSWVIDDDTLIVSGYGAIKSTYTGNYYPWGDYHDDIKHIIVMEGIERIPSYTFEYCEKAETISLPNTLRHLTLNAFNDCGKLNNILLPASLTTIDGTSNSGLPAFIRCESLTDMYYQGTAEEWNRLTSGKNIISCNSTMTKHFLQYNEHTVTCTQAGIQGYYAFDNTSVYGYYDENKNPISEPKIVPALGHRVIKEAETQVDPLTIDNSDTVLFTITDGTYYSNNKSHNSSSQLKITAQYDCSLTLRYGVSSESNYDKLIIKHNNTQKDAISGVVANKTLTLNLIAGDVVTISYEKDVTGSSNQDMGWVKPEHEFVTVVTETDALIDTIQVNCPDSLTCDYCSCTGLGIIIHNEEILPEREPTCTAIGLSAGTICTTCGTIMVAQQEIPMLSHRYSERITAPATHTAEGIITYTCICGDTYTESITKTTEHTYNAVVTAPTCTDEGSTVYTCTCGDSYVDNITGLSDHTDGDGDEFCDYCDEFMGSEEENNCSHMCHKSGFNGFIWKIVQFFWKLFGMNPVCECGAAHY